MSTIRVMTTLDIVTTTGLPQSEYDTFNNASLKVSGSAGIYVEEIEPGLATLTFIECHSSDQAGASRFVSDNFAGVLGFITQDNVDFGAGRNLDRIIHTLDFQIAPEDIRVHMMQGLIRRRGNDVVYGFAGVGTANAYMVGQNMVPLIRYPHIVSGQTPANALPLRKGFSNATELIYSFASREGLVPVPIIVGTQHVSRLNPLEILIENSSAATLLQRAFQEVVQRIRHPFALAALL